MASKVRSGKALDSSSSSLRALEQFEQSVLFERFYDEPDFFAKKMFGGLAIYYRGLMIAVLVEGQIDDCSYRGKNYNFPIWRGLLLPTDYEFHNSLLLDLKGVMNHPVLGKWLYLPLDSDQYDSVAKRFILFIAQGDARFGIVPSSKKRSTRTKKRKSQNTKASIKSKPLRKK